MKINFYATLRDIVGGKTVEFDLAEDITVRQLVVHTAGVPNPMPLDWFHLVAKHYQYDENAELARRLKKSPELKSTPGTKYGYSNLGYWLLSKVIESAAGMPYRLGAPPNAGARAPSAINTFPIVR